MYIIYIYIYMYIYIYIHIYIYVYHIHMTVSHHFVGQSFSSPSKCAASFLVASEGLSKPKALSKASSASGSTQWKHPC